MAILAGMALLAPPLAALAGVLGYWLARGTRPRLSAGVGLALALFPGVSWLIPLGLWLTGQSAADAILLSFATAASIAGVFAIARPPSEAGTKP